MGLPHLLLVDDSEAVLALMKAALSGRYQISTAKDGREAMAKVQQVKPACMLLDLTMPVMGGDEVLARLGESQELRAIPVIVVSSETERAAACLRAGAKAFVPKPIRTDEVSALLERVLADAERERRKGSLAVVFLSAGDFEIGVPIGAISAVMHQVATRPLPVGPFYLSEMIEVHGEQVLVLDLARRLGVDHRRPVEDRKLVLVSVEGRPLALSVDGVSDPEEIAEGDLARRDRLGGGDDGPLREALIGLARTSRGPLPVVDPAGLTSRHLLQMLRGSAAKASAA